MRIKDRKLKYNSSSKMEIYAVVSGSFNRFLPQIQGIIREMSIQGFEVLSPKVGSLVSKNDGFLMFQKDKGSPGDIERNHLEAIAKSDFLYVVNPEGYIGQSVALEIGYALSKGIPIYCSERPKEQVFASLVLSGILLNKIKKTISRKKREMAASRLKPSFTLVDLQDYVAQITKTRGFSKENLADVTLLMVEEFGELAKAVRLKTGLKLAKDSIKKTKSIGAELADCLVYLVDLANLSNVKLDEALRLKEGFNVQRKWVKAIPSHI